MPPRKLIAIIGPTASGKTALAAALARALGDEIIGADSRQVYRHMDIGTAKPSSDEQAAAPHHLVDIVDPDQPFSLADWLERAHAALGDIWSCGKLPLLVGGTGQYVASRRSEDLLAELRRVDPEAEEYIDPRNVRRVIRALEVYEATGKPFSHWRTKEPPPFDALIIGLALPREELYRRVDERVKRMVEAGFTDEVRALLAMGYSRDLPAMSGIGYKEMCEYLAGERDLESAIERTKSGTHRLARHQSAWFKQSDKRIKWLPANDPKIVARATAFPEYQAPPGRCALCSHAGCRGNCYARYGRVATHRPPKRGATARERYNYDHAEPDKRSARRSGRIPVSIAYSRHWA